MVINPYYIVISVCPSWDQYEILAMARVNPRIPWCNVKSRDVGTFCGNTDKYGTLRKAACLSPSKLDKDTCRFFVLTPERI